MLELRLQPLKENTEIIFCDLELGKIDYIIPKAQTPGAKVD